MTSVTGSTSIPFQDAIALTQSLMARMAADDLNEDELRVAIAALVQSKTGVRGFFATYLTADSDLADRDNPAIIQALKSSPDLVADILVKNLAMSTAMAMAHRRQGNEEMAQGSERVRSRTTRLIHQVSLSQVYQQAEKLHESATTGLGDYQSFLQRWGYDPEQRQAICQILAPLLPSSSQGT